MTASSRQAPTNEETTRPQDSSDSLLLCGRCSRAKVGGIRSIYHKTLARNSRSRRTFSDSDNRWLNRSAILFPFGYKSRTDQELPFGLCANHAQGAEFFIERPSAGRCTNTPRPIEYVKRFVGSADHSDLSKREALKTCDICGDAVF